jgi:diguanylate cyclase
LEKEQQQFRAVETALKRLVGRLCIASLGQSPRLDDEIKKLQTAMRRDLAGDELDKITSALTDAINVLDQRAAPPSAAPAAAPVAAPSVAPSNELVGDERIRAALAALLSELRRDPSLILHVDALDAKLGAAMTREQLPDVLSSFAEIVARRIHAIERAKQEIEALLSHMVGKLDEIGQFVFAQTQNQTQSLASSETLNSQLAGEMRAMGESVDAAADVQQIRAQVRRRLESIDKHLQEFRQRESERANEMRARAERMQARVAELEAEAGRLHNQLKDEQKMSTLDVLTKIPNRLAYEKRIDEELKRWQRFKQPVCIAVWDVDRFKQINDTYGHSAGDRVLRAVAEALAGRIRGTDFIARFGGEEFVMILCGTKLDDALRVVDEMRAAIANLKMHSKGTPLAITISCGVTALLPDDTAGVAFDRADKALYQAKESGRNRCLSG